MNGQDEANNFQGSIKDFYLPDQAQITKLRKIIRSETGFKCTYKDAEEISYQLLMLYETLARGQRIVAGKSSYEPRE